MNTAVKLLFLFLGISFIHFWWLPRLWFDRSIVFWKSLVLGGVWIAMMMLLEAGAPELVRPIGVIVLIITLVSVFFWVTQLLVL